jgi:hypothetical protein
VGQFSLSQTTLNFLDSIPGCLGAQVLAADSRSALRDFQLLSVVVILRRSFDQALFREALARRRYKFFVVGYVVMQEDWRVEQLSAFPDRVGRRVEIESEWMARRRERMGIFPKLPANCPTQAKNGLEWGTRMKRSGVWQQRSLTGPPAEKV